MPGKILQNCEHEGHLDPPFGKHYHFSFDLITGVTPYNMTLVVDLQIWQSWRGHH